MPTPEQREDARPLRKRAKDYYLLKPRYRWEINAFLYAALAVSIVAMVVATKAFQSSQGIEPGTPIASWGLVIGLMARLIPLLAICLAAGVFLHTLAHMVFRSFSWRQAIGAALLSRYPRHWYAEGADPEADQLEV